MNPILNAMNQTAEIDKAKQMYKAYQTATDPGRFVRDMINNNPMLGQLARCGNLQNAFYDLCKQRGVNPDDILNAIRR